MGDKLLFNKDDYGDNYEPTDSEDNYSDEEKELLQNVRKGRRREQDSKQELMAFDDSDDDDDADVMGDSDIEGADDNDDAYMPDSKDWGNKARNYYNTDFVDPDFDAYNAEEEEMAKAEEEEAKLIQLRLAKQMREEDFLLDEYQTTVNDSDKQRTKLESTTKVKADFAGLTERERKQLFQKDSPEFAALAADFSSYSQESQTLLTPVLQYVKLHKVPMIPALKFTQTYQNIVLTYCSNIAFYLLLKSKRISIRTHPITKRLVELRQLLVQLKDKHENIIRPQLEALLERIEDGDDFEVLEIKPTAENAKTKKSKLSILDQYDENDPTSTHKQMGMSKAESDDASSDDDDETAELLDDEDVGGDENVRRSITYQMAKNKGLTPNRKKELRNPRVKHRSKFRKALIRRKGAVRTVRTETKRYGGEVSGIKAGVSKSIKFKS